MADVIEALVEGGKASAGPPLGPALGPMGVNIMQVINTINEKTKEFSGMKVPVKVIVDPKTKAFDITVGTPPASALILDAVKAEKGSGSPKTAKVGNLSVEAAIKISKMKAGSLLGKTLKARAKEIMGTCVSMGVNVDGKDPREAQKALDRGDYDAIFKKHGE